MIQGMKLPTYLCPVLNFKGDYASTGKPTFTVGCSVSALYLSGKIHLTDFSIYSPLPQWAWNGVHSASCVQLRSYLEEKVVAPV
jgi:hypothetical protein